MKRELAVFKALSDETRLRILILLARSELCVCEIEQTLGLTQSKVSRHLTVLRNAGLVLDRREGTWIHYRPAPPRNDLERALWKCLGTCFDRAATVQRDMKRLRAVLGKGRDVICRSGKGGRRR